MKAQTGMLYVLWGLGSWLLLCSKGGEAYPPGSLPNQGWIPGSETGNQGKGDETDSDVTPTPPFLYFDPTATQESSGDWTGARKKGGEEPLATEGGHITPQRGIGLLSALKGASAFLALILCLGLALGARRRQAGKAILPSDGEPGEPPEKGTIDVEKGSERTGSAASDKVPEDPSVAQVPEDPSVAKVPEDPSVAKARESLGKLRGLLPAAESLVEAVGTIEARDLLKHVQQSILIWEAEPEAEAARDSKALQSRLTSALEALRMLHQAALGQAQAIVQEQRELENLVEYNSWEEEVNVLLTDPVKAAVAPFLTSFHGFRDSYDRLHACLCKIYFRLMARDLFKSEEDGEILQTVARDLASLRLARDKFNWAADGAREMRERASDTVRAILLGHAENDARQLQEMLEFVEAYFAVARNIINTRRSSPITSNEEAAALLLTLQPFGEELKEAKTLGSVLQAQSESLRRSSSIAEMLACRERALPAKRTAMALLLKCSEFVRAHLQFPDILDATSKEPLLRMAQRAYDRVVADKAGALEILKEARKIIANDFPTLESGLEDHQTYVSHTVAMELKQTIERLFSQVEFRVADTADLLTQVERFERSDVVTTAAKWATSNSVFTVPDKTIAATFLLNLRLLAYLQRDMEYSATQAARTAETGDDAADVQALIDIGRAAGREAKNLDEAAQAAANMRAQADEAGLLSHQGARREGPFP